MLCGFSSLWWPFGWNWSYLGFLGIIWRTCGSKCGGEGGGIFPTLCVECCLVWLFKPVAQGKLRSVFPSMQQCWHKPTRVHMILFLFAPALPELLWLPTVWRCPYIEIAFSTLDCSIVPTCGAWCSATAAKRGPLKQSWAEIQHSRDDEPLGVLMQMRNVRVNGFFFFSSLGVLPGVLVDTLSLCSGDFCVECVLIVLHKFYIEL